MKLLAILRKFKHLRHEDRLCCQFWTLIACFAIFPCDSSIKDTKSSYSNNFFFSKLIFFVSFVQHTKVHFNVITSNNTQLQLYRFETMVLHSQCVNSKHFTAKTQSIASILINHHLLKHNLIEQMSSTGIARRDFRQIRCFFVSWIWRYAVIFA